MTSGTDRFDELEAKIVRTIELVKTTRQELAAAKAENKALQRELEQLKRERDLVKNKVESLLGSLAELTEETVA
jgi:FtsZ-binding cell division protein ZapB